MERRSGQRSGERSGALGRKSHATRGALTADELDWATLLTTRMRLYGGGANKLMSMTAVHFIRSGVALPVSNAEGFVL